MTHDSARARTAASVNAMGGVAAGLVAGAMAYWVLTLQSGPYDGWLLGFITVLATAGVGAAIARSSGRRAFGIALAVTPLVLFVALFLFDLALGAAIGS